MEIRSPKPQFYLPNLNKSHSRTSGRTSAPILPRHEPFLHARSSPKRSHRTPESLVAHQGLEPPRALFAFQNPKCLSRGAPIPSLLLGCPHPYCQADLLRLADPRPSQLPRGFSQKYGLGTFELRPSWWVASGDEPFAESWALLTAPLRDSALSLPPSYPPTPPCPPCGLACFLPRLADLPTALLGRKPARACFQRHSKAKAGQVRPHPHPQLPLVSEGWVGVMVGAEDLDPAGQGSTRTCL